MHGFGKTHQYWAYDLSSPEARQQFVGYIPGIEVWKNKNVRASLYCAERIGLIDNFSDHGGIGLHLPIHRRFRKALAGNLYCLPNYVDGGVGTAAKIREGK